VVSILSVSLVFVGSAGSDAYMMGTAMLRKTFL